MKRKLSKRAALRVRIKRLIVTAGMERMASRRAIRAVMILLGLERA